MASSSESHEAGTGLFQVGETSGNRWLVSHRCQNVIKGW